MLKYLILSWLIIGSAFGAPRIIVLTSLNQPRFENKVSKYVEKHLLDFEVELKHNATQDELYQAILSKPDGLIWLSHGSSYQMEIGIGATPQVLDYQKEDVSPLFQILKPETQFLSIVSCYAEAALKFNKIDANSFSGSYFPRGKVIGMKGFKRAVKALKITNFESIYSPVSEERETLNIHRALGNKTSLRVFHQQKFLGLINSDSATFALKDLKGTIRLEYPKVQDLPTDDEWGEINIYFNDQKLNVFSDHMGKPFGTYSRVFK